jgi:hypothetical protein
MCHSLAYKYFIEAYNAKENERRYHEYQSNLFDGIYDWEIDEVEDMIWNRFNKTNDSDLDQYLPRLKKYDGIKILLLIFKKTDIGLYRMTHISLILFKATGMIKYINILKKYFYKLKRLDRVSTTVDLSCCDPNEHILKLLFDIYLEDEDAVVRFISIEGILYQRGYMKSPDSLEDSINMRPLISKFEFVNKKDRKKIIDILKNGDLNKMKE